MTLDSRSLPATSRVVEPANFSIAFAWHTSRGDHVLAGQPLRHVKRRKEAPRPSAANRRDSCPDGEQIYISRGLLLAPRDLESPLFDVGSRRRPAPVVEKGVWPKALHT